MGLVPFKRRQLQRNTTATQLFIKEMVMLLGTFFGVQPLLKNYVLLKVVMWVLQEQKFGQMPMSNILVALIRKWTCIIMKLVEQLLTTIISGVLINIVVK